jgi:hypothetical protein
LNSFNRVLFEELINRKRFGVIEALQVITADRGECFAHLPGFDAFCGDCKIELLESLLKDVESGLKQFNKFDNMVDAAKWAKDEGTAGNIVVIYIAEEDKWVPHVVEADLSLSPICDCSGEAMNVNSYVPRQENDKLIFELGTPTEEEIVIDIDKTNEWGSLDGSTEELGGNYVWEPIV